MNGIAWMPEAVNINYYFFTISDIHADLCSGIWRRTPIWVQICAPIFEMIRWCDRPAISELAIDSAHTAHPRHLPVTQHATPNQEEREAAIKEMEEKELAKIVPEHIQEVSLLFPNVATSMFF